MVKADIKHNYYADLDLPGTCSLEDVKKQFRKLALQYHPDRNAGREEEFVPKFQAIQTAHEILSDPTQRARYDADRRKTGLERGPRAASAATSGPTPTGNPYSATSAYPPPPRRTQPGQWQRPPPSAAGAAPNGADRFSSFTRAAPTAARKDPAQDRTNNLRAWQNLNNAQDRQGFFNTNNARNAAPQGTPGSAATGMPGAQPSPSRPRPPPRPESKMPSEEEIRAGTSYRKAPPTFDGAGAEDRQTAWQAFQKSQNASSQAHSRTNSGSKATPENGATPTVNRTKSSRTPRKPGFDPNIPGSDERPASGSAGNYGGRHKSADFGRPEAPTQQQVPAQARRYPVPPPPPHPPGAFPQPSPVSPNPTSPTFTRAYTTADPLRPFKSREAPGTVPIDPEVPFTEGNRQRTPYTTSYGGGERKEYFSSDGLRRSASTRDATRLHTTSPGSARQSNGGAASNLGVGGGGLPRARSTSPLGRRPQAGELSSFDQSQQKQSETTGGKPKFVVYSSDESSSESASSPGGTPGRRTSVGPTPDDDSGISGYSDNSKDRTKTDEQAQRPSSTTHQRRPKKTPTPPSRRFDGSRYPFSPPPPVPENGHVEGQSNDGSDSTRQQNAGNMYEHPFSFSTMPSVPASYLPILQALDEERQSILSVDEAFDVFNVGLVCAYGHVPPNLDLDVFLQLAKLCLKLPPGQDVPGTGHLRLDILVRDVERMYPGVMAWEIARRQRVRAAATKDSSYAATHIGTFSSDDCIASLLSNKQRFADARAFHRFNPPFGTDFWSGPGAPPTDRPTIAKSVSVENVDTQFSPTEWNGTFTGGDGGTAQTQPRRGMDRAAARAATAHTPGTDETAASATAAFRRPFGSDGGPALQPESTAKDYTDQGGEVRFSREQWEKTFSDASWTWPPPPPPNPPPAGSKSSSPTRRGTQTRKSSSRINQGGRPDTRIGEEQPSHIVEEPQDTTDEKATDAAVQDDAADAMDIDEAPPAASSQGPGSAKEPRLYAVPPSTWRQQQEQEHKRKKQSNGGWTAKASKSEDASLKTNLDDLAHVEPMMARSGGDGLKDLSDIGATLPFTSQAASTLPTQAEQPHKLQLPPLPQAPDAPHKLTRDSWHAFAQVFGAYLKAYHSFNQTMLGHFVARETQAQARMQGDMSWLEASGDTAGNKAGVDGLSGYGSYVQGIKEDESVRELWALGCERHAEACKDFERKREWVRKLAVQGMLS